MIRVVLDTNILVSALLTTYGVEADVVRASFTFDNLQACISAEMFAEYQSVLGRAKFDRVRDQVEPLLQPVWNSTLLVRSVRSGRTSPDPTDTILIDCATAANAALFVTGNKRHFPQPFYGRTEVVDARQLLLRLPTAL